MNFIEWLAELIDIFLIAPYRWPEDPVMGWWLGTLILAVWATLLGEVTGALAFKSNRSHLGEIVQRMVKHHSQSINALRSGNKEAYKAINRLANEDYGKAFFNQLAMASSTIWPAPFALAWLRIRFSEIYFPLPFDLPLVGRGVGYPFIFILLYILMRIFFRKIGSYLKN
jgi:hypothetical protein